MESMNELREFAGRCAGGMGGDALRHIADKIEAEVAERYVELPTDADGEYIHIGDRMENNERVARIVLTDGSWEPSVYTEESYNVLHEHFCNEISHYRKPTVEDVLREFTDAILDWSGKSGSVAEVGTWSDMAAAYIARLRLAGDAE